MNALKPIEVILSSARFVAAGEALYGAEWRRGLGRQLGVNERQIRRWASGEYEPPAGVWVDIASLCETQAAVLTALAARLRRPAP